jgi:transposase
MDQLALEFEEPETSAVEDELAAEEAAIRTTTVRAFTSLRAERDTSPDHLPRERMVIDPPAACACSGGKRKLGKDVTQTLETTPRRWKVIETMRQEFSCRDCKTISQAPAAFPDDPERESEPAGDDRVREGRPAPAVKSTSRAAWPPRGQRGLRGASLRRLVEAHVIAAERLNGDDTTVPSSPKARLTRRAAGSMSDDVKAFSRQAALPSMPN